MAFCPNCGAETASTAPSCPRCAASFEGEHSWKPLEQPPESPAPTNVSSAGSWYWVLGGAIYGLLVRVLFGALPDPWFGVMSSGFLVGTPFVVGALTVYGARHRNPTPAFLLFAPWLTIALMLLGCAVTLLEGAICIALMAPLFLLCGSVGGVTMGFVLKFVPLKQSHLRTVAALPLIMLFAEPFVPLASQESEIRRSVRVHAPPNVVWEQIHTARSIRPDELPLGVTHLIGVPKPLEGINVAGQDGEIRYSRWERGVNFRAVVTERKEHERISWRYVFDEQSFPKGSMDDHVAIGGRYFDLRDTTFNLTPLPGGHTQLEIVARYRVTSSVNLYAVPAAKLLGHDFVGTILHLYKTRSERASPGGGPAGPT
jgi:hypothetical protein